MPENTFDIASKIDLNEVSNAVQQTTKEIGTRYDLKDSKSSVELNEKDHKIMLASSDQVAIDAVAAKNPALADAIVVDCQFSRKGRGDGPRAYVGEIRVLIAKDAPATPKADGWPASFVPRTSVGYGANSGCPKGVGYLPGGFDQ